ncbi:MAG: hypothetical protein KBA72_05470 [Thermoanaerobaculia bacterium]|nr:hypothetical protein [Thermoanaerobaculia bacterium]
MALLFAAAAFTAGFFAAGLAAGFVAVGLAAGFAAFTAGRAATFFAGVFAGLAAFFAGVAADFFAGFTAVLRTGCAELRAFAPCFALLPELFVFLAATDCLLATASWPGSWSYFNVAR